MNALILISFTEPVPPSLPTTALKRKHAGEKCTEATEKPVSKRRKMGESGATASGRVTEADVVGQKVTFKKKITQTVTEKEMDIVEEVEDPGEMDDDTEMSGGPVRVEEQEKVEELEQVPAKEKGKAAHKNDGEKTKKSLIKRGKKKSRDFFENLYHQRIGRLNSERLSATRAIGAKDSVNEIWRDATDKAGVKQTEKQQQLESVFRARPDLLDARRRLEFVKPYMDNKKKKKKEDEEKKWSSLSLFMRLNLIESLKAIEGEKLKGEEKDWEALGKEAKRIRVLCEVAQYHMRQPECWADYEQASKENEGFPSGVPIDDELLALGASSSEKEEEEEEEDTPATPKPASKPKTPFLWEHFNFTPAQQNDFEALCAKKSIPDIPRDISKAQWKAEEFRFCHEWVTFKSPDAKWTPKSADTLEMSRAHKEFFTDFLFEGGKTKSMCRNGPAMLRHLKDYGGKEFERLLSGSAAVAGDDEDDDGDGDDVAEERTEGIQTDNETGLELNKAGYLTKGGKKKEDMKRQFEEKTGQKLSKEGDEEEDEEETVGDD